MPAFEHFSVHSPPEHSALWVDCPECEAPLAEYPRERPSMVHADDIGGSGFWLSDPREVTWASYQARVGLFALRSTGQCYACEALYEVLEAIVAPESDDRPGDLWSRIVTEGAEGTPVGHFELRYGPKRDLLRSTEEESTSRQPSVVAVTLPEWSILAVEKATFGPVLTHTFPAFAKKHRRDHPAVKLARDILPILIADYLRLAFDPPSHLQRPAITPVACRRGRRPRCGGEQGRDTNRLSLVRGGR